ncbi:MAG: hypothetical protein EHM27_07585 [Deltaproteobacteria bacterium]|nr:MAG: hypothetical protein EHM27_07585 [Deltaproteobacteria bacterium]
MRKEIIQPARLRKSQYGVDPALVKKRGAELPGMTSVRITDLFPELPQTIYPGKEGAAAVRRETEAALANVDMSRIKPGQTVNILTSHHGFTILGGEPYVEMIRTIKDVVVKRTGAKVRLRAGVGLRFRETEEYIKSFGLDLYFEGEAMGMAPIDRGIPIETEIGTLYGLKKTYDADWIIHAHNSDVREIHFHRQVDRAIKPFGMSYARIETRSTYHQNLGPRGANFVARSIFNSPFVQSKFAFASFLIMSPHGVVKVDADNDLDSLDQRVNVAGLKYYGKILNLMGEIDSCITILDFSCPVCYVFAAGVIYANFLGANRDLFDLDGTPLPPYTWYTEAFYDKAGSPMVKEIPPINPAIKMVVQNHAWVGYPSKFFSDQVPTVVVGNEQAELFNLDSQNHRYMENAVVAETLEGAMDFARRLTGTDQVIIFDGAAGGLNLSEPLAKRLEEAAPGVRERVDRELLPKWMKQRGIDLKVLEQIP